MCTGGPCRRPAGARVSRPAAARQRGARAARSWAGCADPSGPEARAQRISEQGAGQACALIVQNGTYSWRADDYQKSDISRERILEAATELFSTRGYAGAGRRPAGRALGHRQDRHLLPLRQQGRPAGGGARARRDAVDRGRSSRRRGRAATRSSACDRALAGMRAMLEERPWIYKLFQILALEVARREAGDPRHAAGHPPTGARRHRRRHARRARRRRCPTPNGVAGMMLATLDGISLGMQIDPEIVSLDEVFAELRRVVAFMVASRLNPELARLFDDPPSRSACWPARDADERSRAMNAAATSDR